MKRILITLITTLSIGFMAKGQNLFFIGENSYQCTEFITLKANSNDDSDLIVSFGWGKTGDVFTVSTEFILPALFGEELFIYLENGAVITSDYGGWTESIDDSAKAVFYLTDDQLNMLKKSNIHTVRYTLENDIGEWGRSASNKGTSTSNIITKFFRE